MADHRGIRRRNSAAGEFDGENTKERLEATIATIKNLRKVRVICSDPDATDDSSSDEADDHDRSSTRRIVCEIVLPVTSDEAVEQKGKGKVEGEGEGGSGKARGKKKCPGVRMRKWGRWAAEIRDPFSRKRLWLGSFNTEEEASIAYLAKKEEFRARLEKEGPNVQPLSEGGSSSKTPTGGSQEVDNSADGKEKETHSSGRVDSREELTRAQCKGSQFAQMSKLGESCAKPFKKRKNWLGTSDASEEKSNAFLFKKLDCGKGCTGRPGSEIGSYLKSPKAETLSLFSDAGGEAVSGTTTASMEVSGEEGEGQVGPDGKGEEKKQSWLGLGLGTLAIDNNGNLLGEFSKLDDDLKIC